MLKISKLLYLIFFLYKVILIITVALTIGLLYTYKIEPSWIVVREQPIYIKNLPRNFEGFRIVQLSDLHGKSFYHNELVNKINKLKPDMVAITGDIFDKKREILLDYLDKSIRGIKPIDGGFFVFGNNDYYLGQDAVVQAFSDAGFNALVNKNVKISVKGEEIWILGVDDLRRGDPDFSEALRNTGNGVKILLAHTPEVINEANKAGIDLVLSGHTHGGQVRLPFVEPFLPQMKHEYRQYVSGLYQVGNTQMYVNSGLGVSSALPLRFMVRPEITVITLHRAR